ncbi:MAG: hypothetical protein AAGH46_07565, partial [Bacteroidota bacterium]
TVVWTPTPNGLQVFFSKSSGSVVVTASFFKFNISQPTQLLATHSLDDSVHIILEPSVFFAITFHAAKLLKMLE